MRGVSGAVAAVLVLTGCGEKLVEPSLELSASPTKIKRDGSKTTITVSATDEHGKPGAGDVYLESSAGTLIAGTTVALDSSGIAETAFACDVSKDPGCFVDALPIAATWRRAKGNVHGSLNVQLLEVSSSGATGGGGGGGSGSFANKEVLLSAPLRDTSLHYGLVVAGAFDKPKLGLPKTAGAQLSPQGSIYYLHNIPPSPITFEIRQYVEDAPVLGTDGKTWAYPADPEANDPVVPTPKCSAVESFAIQAVTGALYYQCGSAIHGPSTDFDTTYRLTLFAVTASETLLVAGASDLYVLRAGAAPQKVTGFGPNVGWVAIHRVHGDGFYVVTNVTDPTTPGLIRSPSA